MRTHTKSARFARQGLLALLLGGLLCSCSYGPTAAPGISPDDLQMERAGPVIVDPSLAGELEVGNPRADRLPSGKLRLTVPLRNVSDEYLVLLVKVTFCDEHGSIRGDETPRQTVGLPRGTSYHTVTSFKSHANRYLVQIDRSER